MLPERVHEEVRDVDARERGRQRGRIGQVALNHLDLSGPGHIPEPARAAREAADGVAGLEQAGGQAPADVAGGARDETTHTNTVPADRGGQAICSIPAASPT
ncbi:hypothetical protein Ani05nite_69130 [Amorphoplanes nipponensis]|uniref:Uncharacterized protein n=1 Tax=Actinoplanes nipponensis TaxID=135950 RepID=A0A919JUS7_9ACTN|nr:hypothetical protein Ani05nite_69130 [Actinoplanes nipponensis]